MSERQTILAVMGGASRRGSWVPPRKLQILAVMGGAELDFREARFGAEGIDINIFALMGGVEIIIPPGVRVEISGVALMGGFEEHGSTSAADAYAPVLRVGGFALMGGVEIRTRYPGESGREAKRREKLRKKEMRRLGGIG